MSTATSDHFHRIVPLERFREIFGALDIQRHSFNDERFLRFAALTAVMTPDQPTEIAHRIQSIAQTIYERASWFSDLATGARFIVAAALADNHEGANIFMAEHKRLREAFKEHGLPQAGVHETMAILILHLGAGGHLVDLWTIARMRHIYDVMKKQHWWLTGGDDLAACAALTALDGDVEDLVENIEEVYQGLHQRGLTKGNQLQSAANLLPLVECKTSDLLDRYDHLLEIIHKKGPQELNNAYTALTLLASLDHPAERVLAEYQATMKELTLTQWLPSLHDNTILAADLTAIDLARYDTKLNPPDSMHTAELIVRRLNQYRIAGLVLACESEPWAHAGETGQPFWPHV